MLPFPCRAALLGLACCWGAFFAPGAAAADRSWQADYFRFETARLTTNAFAGIDSLADWQQRRARLKEELLDMLGLVPMPPREDLHATVTGQLEGDGLIVEKLHFQSSPGLYVTANVYRPREIRGRLPAVLYVCGHSPVKTNGVSCGNKAAYQHHGIWFARHGYVCLVMDTLQLGEIEGVHHGTYRMGQWWWNSRGYSPAGLEAWNGIRALDYLQSRPDVDPDRIGMTGRSGGGSYTWTTAAIDERVRVAAPVAGITDLHNQVLDDVVEGHCDCMFFVNTHRWDFGLNAALVAPRPLLIVNTDSDTIFPLDGVERLHEQVRRIYRLHGVSTNLGLVIGPGPHQDTQDLQVPVFRWFNRHLKGEDPKIEVAARPMFSPLQLRVFDRLPENERNTRAAEWFGVPSVGTSTGPLDWTATIDKLRNRVFGGWPSPGEVPPVQLASDQVADGVRMRSWEFESQPGVRLRLDLLSRGAGEPATVEFRVADDSSWARWSGLAPAARAAELAETVGRRGADAGLAVLAPRGIGPTELPATETVRTHLRRRFMLLGQTLDGMRVWDIRRGLQALRAVTGSRESWSGTAAGDQAVNMLYATLFEPGVGRLVLKSPPRSHRTGPDYLNVLQVIDIPQATELARQHGIQIEIE